MPLTRNFTEFVKARIERDPEFAQALFREAVQNPRGRRCGNRQVGVRDDIKATIGFEKLAKTTRTPAKSLIRMFGPGTTPRDNPTAGNRRPGGLLGEAGRLSRGGESLLPLGDDA